MRALSINVFAPLLMGGYSITALSALVNAWRHSIRAIGGYWDGAFSIRGGPLEMEDWFANGLGRHVEVRDDALVTIWEGFVNKVTITTGPISIVIGPLMDATNRCAVIYAIKEGTEYKARDNTEEGNDTDAQDKYGIITQYLSVSGATKAKAEQIRDSHLEDNAWPAIVHDISATRHEPNIIVDCLGYVRWLERVVYNQLATTGDVYLEDKLKSVILSEPNGFFDLGNVSLLKELLLNVNFEEPGAGGADVWADWVEVANGGTISNVTTDHKEGSNCASLTSDASVDTHIYQDVTVEAGKAYRLTFWTRDLDNDSVTGAHDGNANSEFLEDSSEDFLEDGVKNKQTVTNNTDGSTAEISDVTETRVYGELSGGTDNDWDVADTFTIVTGAYQSRYQIYDNTNAADIVALENTSEFGNTSWHKVTVIFYAPEDCTSVRIYLYSPDTDAKQVYFDAVSVKEYNEAMAALTTFVPAYEYRERTAWAIVKELLSYGDYENNRYNWGVYADRKVRMESIPEDFEYMMSALDVGRGYSTMDGGKVEDYNLLPGKWLYIADILTGLTASSLRRDPKAMFIEEVRYSAEQGLTINPGKTGDAKQAIAKLGLVGR